MSHHRLLVYGSSSYHYLTDQVTKIGHYDAGKLERRTFMDGERYQRILDDVAYRDIVIIGGTISDTETMEIYDLACAIAKYGASTVTLIVPFFGYSTMERAVKTGEVVTAKSRARLFSAIPIASNGNRIAMIDLHAEGIPHYFEGSIASGHVYAKPVILEAIREIAESDYVLACTDAGRAKWVESLANDLGVMAAFILKRRIEDGHTQVSAVNANVQGRHVIIYDDMIRTGSSLMSAAKAYREAGAGKVSAVATHGLFPGDSIEKLRQSQLFEQIVVTDTHPRAMQFAGDFLKVKTVAGLIVELLDRMQYN